MKILEWVNSAKNSDDIKFRKAIHLILLAISKNSDLSSMLIIKGGIVMSLVHKGKRYTSDLDATSVGAIDKLTTEKLEKYLTRYLKGAEINIGYGLGFNIHSIKTQPKNYMEAKYPAYKVKIGYANLNNDKEMERLKNKQSSSIIEIDISFNEPIIVEEDTVSIQLAEDRSILCYSLEQIIAEKYRSLLQQRSRNRHRRQDVYDIYYLLTMYDEYLSKDEVKKMVLNKLKKCSEDKGIDAYLHKEGILDEEIKRMSLHDFKTLELEIDINNIDPENMFDRISNYFFSLPW